MVHWRTHWLRFSTTCQTCHRTYCGGASCNRLHNRFIRYMLIEDFLRARSKHGLRSVTVTRSTNVPQCKVGEEVAKLRRSSEKSDIAGSLPTNSDIILPNFSAVALAYSFAVLLPLIILYFFASLLPCFLKAFARSMVHSKR